MHRLEWHKTLPVRQGAPCLQRHHSAVLRDNPVEAEKSVERDFDLVSVSVCRTAAAASASEDWPAKRPIVAERAEFRRLEHHKI
jgi:hypothetical protein